MFILLVTGLAWAQDRGARADDAAAIGDAAYVPAPKDRLYQSNSIFLRGNPLGLIDVYRIGWRHRLSEKDSLLMRDTSTFLAASVVATPAWARVGAYAEIQPVALLRLFADVSGVGFYGTFDQVLSWDDPSARYSDQTIEAEGDRAEPRTGWVATVGGTLQAKAGPVAVRSTAQATRFDVALPAGDVVFYDQYWDRLAPNQGWMLLNDLDLLVVGGDLRVGARYTTSMNLTDKVEGADGSLAHHRVGPLIAWQLATKPHGSAFNRPTVFALVQWWAQHPYRTGAEQPAGLPLLAAGFAFDGDLLSSRN
jgi:hypothetical protein